MSDQPQPAGNPENESSATKRYAEVTDAALVEFLNSKASGAKCSYCGQSEYLVPKSPKGDSAALITAPVPNVTGLGAWLYMAICPNCGHTTFFHAHIVTALMDGKP